MLSRLLNILKHSRNKNKVSSLGESSLLYGSIDRRVFTSRIDIGSDCLIHGALVTETKDSQIRIGDNVFIGGDVLIDCAVSIVIENDVLIAHGTILADSDNHSISYSVRKKDLPDWKSGGKHDWDSTISKPVLISKGAWIGAKAIILKGVTIGEGAVVGAGSVVSKDVSPYSIVAGNPAVLIRKISLDER